MNTPESPPPRRRRRRWYQYSLRTLFLVVTVAAVLLGIWTGRARRQQEAVKRIRERGGSVVYSSANGPARGPEWLRDGLGIDYFDHVVGVCVVGDSFKDADLEQLQALRGLKTLLLLAPNITDAGLEHVGHLRNLEQIYLGGPGISDAGFAQLKHLRRLTRLTIERGAVIDGDDPPGTPTTYPDNVDSRRTPPYLAGELAGFPIPHSPIREGLRVLHQPTTIEFTNVPLRDVCEYLGTLHGIEVQPATAVQFDMGLRPEDYLVTCARRGPSLGTALDTILPPRGLDWAVGKQGLIVTTKGRATKTTQVTAAAMEHLRDLPNLQVLEVRTPEFAGRGLQHLAGLAQLQELDLEGMPVTDADLAHVAGLDLLRELNLGNTHVTDAGLEHLRGLARLETLDLNHTEINGAGLERLGRLAQLRELLLRSTPVADAELRHLEGLTALRRLDLFDTQIGDAGVEHLKGLTQLEDLVLFKTKVTDAGLRHLKGMTRLRHVGLLETPVTSQGIQDLQKALPRCSVNR